MSEAKPSSQHTIRYATEEDVPEIYAMIMELATYEKAADQVAATEDKLRATLNFPSDPPSKGYAKTLLIFDPPSSSSSSSTSSTAQQKPAGMALYFHNYSTWTAAPGVYLEDLFVRPEHRGKGYGKALLGALAREAIRLGGVRLDWTVLKWNEPSIRFYELMGAQRMDQWFRMRVENEGLTKLAESL